MTKDEKFRRIAAALEEWFRRSARVLPWRGTYDPWHVWVSEIMLQQTRMDVVVPYFLRFVRRFPTVASLAAADQEEVLALWSGLGYYRRARLLHAGARAVVERHGGVIPADAPLLRELPGVGVYTAGAIASIAFERREPVVDGNMQRLIARLRMLESPTGSSALHREVSGSARMLVEAAISPRAVNQAAMEVGSLICRPVRPLCSECPLSSECAGLSAGRPEQWPVRRAAARRVAMEIPLFLVREGQRFLLLQSRSPLMGGMFHLPHGNALLDGSLDLSSAVIAGAFVGSFRHAITTRDVEFIVYEAGIQHEANLHETGDARWVSASELPNLPHPSYVRKALALRISGT